MINPPIDKIIQGSFIPHLPPGGFTNDLFFLIMANIGTTIAPWMIFFQQSAVVDKGMQEKDMRWGKVDTGVGALLTVVVAAGCIILTATLIPGLPISDAATAAKLFFGINKYVGALLAIGLFDAGFLGAICISLASSWAFGEVFGWAHSLNQNVKQAPWFYAYYFFTLVFAGVVVLIPGAPLVLITLFVQVIAVTLLPAALVFLIVLLNDEQTMGKHKNTWFQNLANIGIVSLIIVVSTLYGVSAVFPNILR